jgi:hypothetical protein
VAEIVQPEYCWPCVPPAHVVVDIVNGPPADATVTVAADVAEPEEFVAVKV